MRHEVSPGAIQELQTRIGAIVLEQNAIEESLEEICRSLMPPQLHRWPTNYCKNQSLIEKLTLANSLLASHVVIDSEKMKEFCNLADAIINLKSEHERLVRARLKFGLASDTDRGERELQVFLQLGGNELDSSLPSLDEIIDSYHRVREGLLNFESSLLDLLTPEQTG